MAVKLVIPVAMYGAATLAQADSAMPGWAGSVIQFGSFGVLCFVIWWILTKQQPAQAEAYKVSILSLQDTFTKSLNEIMAESREQTIKFVATVERKDQQLIQIIDELRKSGK